MLFLGDVNDDMNDITDAVLYDCVYPMGVLLVRLLYLSCRKGAVNHN